MAKQKPATGRVTIYHNPRCSTSRKTLALLREKGIEPDVVEYLKSPLDAAALRKLLKLLDVDAAALVRKKEQREAGLPATDDADKVIQQIAKHPQIMQRPIVVKGNQARFGRPPETVLEIL